MIEVNKVSGDWKLAWQPMIDAIGRDFSEGQPVPGADVVEKGLIRRFLEPLEFDSALHYNERFAQKHGYRDVVAPCSSLLTWTLPPYWIPGEKLFVDEAKNAQPEKSPVTAPSIDIAPKTTGYFWTNVEVDYINPIVVGDRLTRVGEVLKSCIPKETSVGRGAFLIWESHVVNDREEQIALVRIETFNYTPHE